VSTTFPHSSRARPLRSGYRRLATAAVAGVMLATTVACGDDSDDGVVRLRFAWWGNNERAAATEEVIAAFEEANPGIEVEGETADFNAYFERLATQIASGEGPDIITLGGAYPAEYGGRGALLDLETVSDHLNMEQLDPAALRAGYFHDTQFGVPTGVNTYALVADPTVFEQAGVPLPDDNTWTWDDFLQIATQISENTPDGVYGVADFMRTDLLDLYARQRGESLYTEDGGLGISEQTLGEVWEIMIALRDAGATPPASVTAELMTQTAPEQSLIGRGLAGMQFGWSSQLAAYRNASGRPLVLLRPPGESEFEQPGMWLQASQIYTINARTEHPEEAARFVDFLVNSVEAGRIIGTDRGIPANPQVREAIASGLNEHQQVEAEFIERVASQVGSPLIIGPAGSADTWRTLDRLHTEVLFDRMTIEDAVEQFFSEVEAAIAQ